ncbi:N-acetyl-gamma-glutamyl-phosphate reductase [Pontibacter ummariensis]|uniref:N-acetyl-gamma-glutamyl-phosphate reductase n=1 Tax=Pontibacter ummariensis TaxID=1610492 RepID=A0A239BW81_9BACT|nr:N-acetyl-gamma-glutamyl-phosphate reductase [Pontibacter ummariensis]PRY15606.1 N-acetyl-gamma-glutamyl-phosphate reductase [Pontibacter ummariensis]SNS11691.1 N-acetyl-gamma-glutamyl-phosphate reductase [Pontibacter ummariensis]
MGSGVSIKAGIVGGAGYTGGELLRLLLNHPQVQVTFVQSKSQAGKPVYAVHQDLLGDTDLHFSEAIDPEVDVLFLCAGHGEAKKFVEGQALAEHIRLIDLSQDFRWNESTTARVVSAEGRDFVYGLPELQKNAIAEAKNIANPGCFATAIQLALLPLAAQGLLISEVHVSGITGSTGAGQSLSPTSHYSWRSGNISNYKVLSHQHLHEIRRTLQGIQEQAVPDINFVPYRGPFTRGILCTSYLHCSLNQEAAQQLYKGFYQTAPFVRLSTTTPDLKQVVNTNKCLVHLEKQGDYLVITSMIDNLLKGASGQAVQNMNLMFGLDEKAGLCLKASGF